MSNYDNLLRQKENDDLLNDSSMEKHWAALEKQMATRANNPRINSRKYRTVFAVVAVMLIAIIMYTLMEVNRPQPVTSARNKVDKSAIKPPITGTNVPYETFTFNAETGDTLFTLNGSAIIFPPNAVLNSIGEIVTGKIEVRTREFNDPFDYSIAGIPMNYDSAGIKYQFISSGMIDINAYQHGKTLIVNPAAKPQLNLVSTNKETNTSLYRLDTVTGQWINKGKDVVTPVNLTTNFTNNNIKSEPSGLKKSSPAEYDVAEVKTLPKPVAPQKASVVNPKIDITVDPGNFKELMVYDGLKFEVMDANDNKVEADSKKEWDDISLQRGPVYGTYKVIFSGGNNKAIYTVKPVLEGKDFEAAEKLYQQNLKKYERLQSERKKNEQALQANNSRIEKANRQIVQDNKRIEQDNERMKVNNRKTEEENKKTEEENKRILELNKLIALRNNFIEAEKKRIEALNKEYEQRRDSTVKAMNEIAQKNKARWEQYNNTLELQQNLIRSFQIDGFGYWNCDQASLPNTKLYASSFKTINKEPVIYNTLCIAREGVNSIQNFYNNNKDIRLIDNAAYFGWSFNFDQLYYFTKQDFKNAVITYSPNTILISMSLYKGDLKNYKELKGYLLTVVNDSEGTKE